MKKRIKLEPIFCKSGGAIFALTATSDGGTSHWMRRNDSWIPVIFADAFRDGIPLSRDEVISLLGRSAVESLPEAR
jgi:hypothetical protein